MTLISQSQLILEPLELPEFPESPEFAQSRCSSYGIQVQEHKEQERSKVVGEEQERQG